MSTGPVIPGHVEISSRALISCARAVVAERLAVPVGRVHVDLDDHQGAIALDITSPIGDAATGIVDSARDSASEIRERLSSLVGRRVGAARLELTGIVRARTGRVR
ncbi:hypothetical protein [Curtobacterium sp. RRHDQ10]|uniref:hypothetical protein n=1 Tax=Curtobacterium phyllosphaerae TaxID=3413379 RepID=UPI003BF27763